MQLGWAAIDCLGNDESDACVHEGLRQKRHETGGGNDDDDDDDDMLQCSSRSASWGVLQISVFNGNSIVVVG